MLDYAIVRMDRSSRSLAILGIAFLILPWRPSLVLGQVRSSLGLSITILFGTLIEYVGYGACACIIAPLAPPIDSKTAAVRALKRTFSS
jgi:hypothetical protein